MLSDRIPYEDNVRQEEQQENYSFFFIQEDGDRFMTGVNIANF